MADNIELRDKSDASFDANAKLFGADSFASRDASVYDVPAVSSVFDQVPGTLVDKNIAYIKRPGGDLLVPDGPGALALDIPFEVTVFTGNGSWTPPAWAHQIEIYAWGGGGAGGGGRCGAAGTDRRGGAGGGAGGLAVDTFLAADLSGGALTITIGAGGTPGVAATTNDTNGGDGGTGGATTITMSGVALLSAEGGIGGTGGGLASGGTPGAARGASYGTANAGAASANGAVGGTGVYLSCTRGPGGGAGGGSISTGNVPFGGGQGGFGYQIGLPEKRAARGTAGAINTNGGDGQAKQWQRGAPGGGGGGGASIVGPAGNGGAGGDQAGGGGGGGASLNGNNSGAGGPGGRGEVWIIARAQAGGVAPGLAGTERTNWPVAPTIWQVVERTDLDALFVRMPNNGNACWVEI